MNLVNTKPTFYKILSHCCALVIVGTLTFGCAGIPANIAVNNEESLLDFKDLMQTPVETLELGAEVRWAGLVVAVEQRDEFAELEVMYLEQNANAAPKQGTEFKGRFKAYMSVEDAKDIRKLNYVTVVGKLGAAKSGLVNNKLYTYPTMQVDEHFVWYDHERRGPYLLLLSDPNPDRFCCQGD
ncbi:Slp family lipoprotein [Ningiella sp. W23]|uniref:Slp family lipoprotein n=1 Tax=Ningiella sp. W23 TaxID=3023715 RepID=UPI0037566822